MGKKPLKIQEVTDEDLKVSLIIFLSMGVLLILAFIAASFLLKAIVDGVSGV